MQSQRNCDGVSRIANVHYIVSGKTLVIQRPLNKLHTIETSKKETDVQLKFIDERIIVMSEQ